MLAASRRVAGARVGHKSLSPALGQAGELAAGARESNIPVMHGDGQAEADKVMAAMKEQLPEYGYAVEGQITPALIVHTGPGLIGIGIQRLA